MGLFIERGGVGKGRGRLWMTIHGCENMLLGKVIITEFIILFLIILLGMTIRGCKNMFLDKVIITVFII